MSLHINNFAKNIFVNEDKNFNGSATNFIRYASTAKNS
jgi:hypothetical protein